MTHYYTPEQEAQVTAFVDRFIAEIEWIKSPDGIDSLRDKAAFDDGTISEQYIAQMFMMYALDALKDMGVSGERLRDRISSTVLLWAMQDFDQENRDALRPFWEEYVK